MTTAKYTPGPYLQDGTLIYSLEHHGWYKGKEVMRNRFHAGVQGYSETPKEELEATAQLFAASPDLLAFAECSAAIDCGRGDPRFDPLPVLRSHGWNGEENAGVFLARIRRDALNKAVGHYLGRAAA